jgi:PAS domain S-box-containing protein
MVVSGYLYYDKITTETDTLKEKLESSSMIGADDVSHWIIDRKNNVLGIAKNQVVIGDTKDILVASDEIELFNTRIDLERQIHVNFQTYDWLDEIIISDINGNSLFHTGTTFVPHDFKDESYFQEAVGGNLGMSEIFSSRNMMPDEQGTYEKGVPTLFISVPIRGEVGIEGILTARVNIFKINNIGKQYLSTFTSADSYFVNSDGYFISKPTYIEKIRELNLIKTRPELELQLVDPDSKKFVSIFQISNKDRTISNINGYRNYVGDIVIGAITHIKQTNWYYVAEVKADDAFSDIITLQIILLFSIIVIILIISVISILFATNLINPIKQLTKKISLSFANEITGSNSSPHELNSEDEIQKLNSTFDSMIKTLSTTTQTIMSSEKKFRALYDNSPELFRTITAKGIITDCNESYVHALGYPKSEIIGASIFDHTAEKSLNALQDSFVSWKIEGWVRNRDIWMKRKDGTTFPTLLSATSIHDENNALIGSNTVIRDMSEIYSAKKEIEEEKIKRLSAIGELSARISHDLRNPLSVIKNTIDIIKTQNPNLDEKTISQLARLERASLRMTHQIDEVLDYVNPKPLQLNNNSISEVLNSTMDRLVIPDKVRLSLPQKDVSVQCDAEKMEAVFANLITNAMQAMNSEGSIDIRILEQADHVIIEVEDTGPGIPDDILPKIFDPLFTTRQVGTGLGLVSCKSIIEKHGGSLSVRTHLDKGTTFVITLPKNQ